MTLTKEQSDWLKVLAVTFMIIDHIGVVFYPEQSIWRIIGRLAFPLFAYQLAVGFQFTKNRSKQWRYLIAFGLLSQISYAMMLGYPLTSLHLNVFFTFAIGYGLMMLWARVNKVWFLTAIAGVFAVFMVYPAHIAVDYGLYGILMPWVFYLLRNHPSFQILFLAMATFWKSAVGSPLQLFAVCSIGVIFLVGSIKLPKIQVNKWFFYWFYPVHIGMLVLLSSIMTT